MITLPKYFWMYDVLPKRLVDEAGRIGRLHVEIHVDGPSLHMSLPIGWRSDDLNETTHQHKNGHKRVVLTAPSKSSGNA